MIDKRKIEMDKLKEIVEGVIAGECTFEFFGVVPVVLIPDNLKAAVIKASFTDPKMNKTYK